MKVSLIIPFIDQPEITKHCIEVAVNNADLPKGATAFTDTALGGEE